MAKKKQYRGLYKQPNGVYFMRVMINGKSFMKSTGETDIDKAARFRDDYLAPYKLKDERDKLSVISGKINDIDRKLEDLGLKIPLDDLWQKFLEGADPDFSSKPDLNILKNSFQKFMTWLKMNKTEIEFLGQITQEDAKAYIDFLSEKLSAKTVQNQLRFFKAVFRILNKKENPFENIKSKKPKSLSRRNLTDDEIKKILTSTEGEIHTLFMVGVYTGLRLKDAALLQVSCVDFKNKLIKLQPYKTKNSSGQFVTIPIHEELLKVLKNLEGKFGYVMPTIASLYLKSRPKLSAKIQDIFKKCGIVTNIKKDGNMRKGVEVGFHSLRHTFVSNCANNGISLDIVRQMVGHTTREMSEKYFHENLETLRNAVQTIPDLSEENTDKFISHKKKSILDKFKSVCEELAEYGLLDEALEILRNTEPKRNDKEVEMNLSEL